LDKYLTLSQEIHTALKKQDIVGLEQIIKKVGAERAFGVHLTEDFSGRRLINFMEHYPRGLKEYRGHIHPELLALAIKYDPHLKLEDRLRYLKICDFYLDDPVTLYSRFTRGADQGEPASRHYFIKLRHRIVKLRKLILDHAPDDEKNLMQELSFIKGNHKSEPKA
jgi:hypothetical protein